MLSDWELWACANHLICKHGEAAAIEAATLGAPYRTVPIPDCRGSAREGLTGGDHWNRGEEKGEGQHQSMHLRRDIPDPLTQIWPHAPVTFGQVQDDRMHAHRSWGSWAAKPTPRADNPGKASGSRDSLDCSV